MDNRAITPLNIGQFRFDLADIYSIEGNVSLGDGMSILPYPGETPGHQILHLEHEGQNYYFGGDLYHHPIEFADVTQHVRWASAAEMQASKATFMKRVAGNGGFAYFTHITGANQVIENKDGKPTWR
jgi:glyoxylase-like metal-dependent hydrolase (beta-lactamase superfamily II)